MGIWTRETVRCVFERWIIVRGTTGIEHNDTIESGNTDMINGCQCYTNTVTMRQIKWPMNSENRMIDWLIETMDPPNLNLYIAVFVNEWYNAVQSKNQTIPVKYIWYVTHPFIERVDDNKRQQSSRSNESEHGLLRHYRHIRYPSLDYCVTDTNLCKSTHFLVQKIRGLWRPIQVWDEKMNVIGLSALKESILRSKCTLYIGVEFSEEYTHRMAVNKKIGDSLVVSLKPGASNVFKQWLWILVCL